MTEARKDDVYYVDYSILSTFQTCQEKARLSYKIHKRPRKTAAALDFGSCFHAAIQARYDFIAQNSTVNFAELLKECELAFISEWQAQGGRLPVQMNNDDGEKRSLERGLWLVRAYNFRWNNELYINIINPLDNKAYTEMGFAIELCTYNGKPVVLVGRWDRIMMSRMDARAWVFEVKTTTQGLSSYVLQVRPNHQLTGYYYAALELLGLDIAGIVWDCAFVSSRQPQPSSKDKWFQVGIDIEKDFARQETKRSLIDLEEWLFDMRDAAVNFLRKCDEYDVTKQRWRRNAPTACHMYGGCQFRDVCSTNLNQSILDSEFITERWEPWKDIVTVPTVINTQSTK